MSGKNMMFNVKKIKKNNFYKNKKLFKIGETGFDKILVSLKKRIIW